MSELTSAKIFVEMMQARPNDLNSDTANEMVALCQYWGRQDHPKELRQYATQLAQALHDGFSDEFGTLLQNWQENFLSDLATECVEWLASSLHRLTDGRRQVVIDALAPVVSDDYTNEQIQAHNTFVNSLQNDALQTAEVEEHLNKVFDRMVAIIPDQTPQQNANIAQEQVDSARNYLIYLLPTLAPLMGHADPEKVGTTINRLFATGANVTNSPEVFASLHGTMVDHWPAIDKVPYNAGEVFDKAAQVATHRPETRDAPELLRSVLSLSGPGELDTEEYQDQTASIAAALWRHHPEEVNEMLPGLASVPSSEEVASLAATTSLEESKEPTEVGTALGIAWRHWTQQLTEEQRVAATIQVLTETANVTNEIALRTWLESVPRRDELVLQLIEDDSIEDGGLARVWRQVCLMASEFSQDFFREALPSTFALSDHEKSQSSILGDRNQISEIFKNQTEKNSLAEALVQAYLRCPDQQAAAGLLTWIHELGATSTVAAVDPEQLEPEQLEQIKGTFGDDIYK